jgi:hypothetical protein
MGTTWDGFLSAAAHWVGENQEHPDRAFIEQLARSDDRLRHTKIKKVRQLICAMLECKKPWEVVVGQAIGALKNEDLANYNMLIDFLGTEMVSSVIFRSAA